MKFLTFFSRAARAALTIALVSHALIACKDPRESASQADFPAAATSPRDPASLRVQAIVRGVREVLPGLPSQGAAVPSWSESAAEAIDARERLTGTGRLIRAEGAESLPSSIGVTLHLDERDPPRGFLLVRRGEAEPERWPILSSEEVRGAGNGDFSLVFRLTDADNRLRFLSVLGVTYGAGDLRFRAFEGYLIFPGKGGTLAARPPLYAIDFGYHWPLPPRHESRLATLKEESARLASRAAELPRIGERIAGIDRQAEALRTSAVPPEQETRRRADLDTLAAQREESLRAREALAGEIATALERIYRLRAEASADWQAFRESNPYRWMGEKERRRSAAPMAESAAWLPGWRQMYESVQGSARPSLREAREAMERALLAEPPATE